MTNRTFLTAEADHRMAARHAEAAIARRVRAARPARRRPSPGALLRGMVPRRRSLRPTPTAAPAPTTVPQLGAARPC